MVLDITIVTLAPCVQAGCARCTMANDVAAEVGALGIPVKKGQKAPHATVRATHLDDDEALTRGLPPLASPAILINGRVVLAGPGWGESHLRQAVLEAARDEVRAAAAPA